MWIMCCAAQFPEDNIICINVLLSFTSTINAWLMLFLHLKDACKEQWVDRAGPRATGKTQVESKNACAVFHNP